MHPVIRIVSFVVLTAFLAIGDWADVFPAGAVLLGLCLRLEGHAWRSAWKLLRRMRWLFLSIAVIYLWLTPGVSLIPGIPILAPWLPTIDGFWQGSLRITSLALMVTAASLLLSVTSRNEVLGALHWMMAPLGWLRFPHERFAVRAALSLEAVARVQSHVRAALAAGGEMTNPWARVGAVTGAIFGTVTAKAECTACDPIVLTEQAPPSPLQWAYPLLLAAVMTAATRLPG